MNLAHIRQCFLDYGRRIAEAKSQQPEMPLGPVMESLTIRAGFTLHGQSSELYQQFLKRIQLLVCQSGPWGDAAIEAQLCLHLAPLFAIGDAELVTAVKAEAQRFIEALKSPPAQFARAVSVFGLEPDVSILSFGKIKIRRGEFISPGKIPGLADANVPIAMHFADVMVEAVDNKSAHNLATDLVDQHLSILNALLSDLGSARVRLATHTLPSNHFRFFETAGNTPEDLVRHVTFTRTTFPASSQQLSEALDQKGGERISRLLQQEDQFAKRITSAYQVAGAASLHHDAFIAFLLFTIALESVVMGSENRGEIAHQLSVRVALTSSAAPWMDGAPLQNR